MADTEMARAAGAGLGRTGALAGLAFFVVVSVITGMLLPDSPYPSDSGQKIFSYLAGHQGRLQASAVLAGLAGVAVLVWASGVFRAMRIVEDETSGLEAGETPGTALAALGGGVLTAASAAMVAIIAGATGTRLDDLGPAGARVFWTVLLIGRGAVLVGLLVIIGATAVVCLRAQLSRWFTGANAVVALVSAVGACTLGYTATWIEIVASTALSIDGAWIAVVGASLMPGARDGGSLGTAWGVFRSTVFESDTPARYLPGPRPMIP